MNSVHSTLIPTTGAGALALHLCRQRVLGFSIWDFGKRFSGYSKVTFGRSAFIAGINGPPLTITCAQLSVHGDVDYPACWQQLRREYNVKQRISFRSAMNAGGIL